jgi:hypothetical protein
MLKKYPIDTLASEWRTQFVETLAEISRCGADLTDYCLEGIEAVISSTKNTDQSELVPLMFKSLMPTFLQIETGKLKESSTPMKTLHFLQELRSNTNVNGKSFTVGTKILLQHLCVSGAEKKADERNNICLISGGLFEKCLGSDNELIHHGEFLLKCSKNAKSTLRTFTIELTTLFLQEYETKLKNAKDEKNTLHSTFVTILLGRISDKVRTLFLINYF